MSIEETARTECCGDALMTPYLHQACADCPSALGAGLARVMKLERQLADTRSTLDATLARALTAERLLEELTPGGSEFSGSPANCAAFVRARFETNIGFVKRAQTAEAALAEAKAALEAFPFTLKVITMGSLDSSLSRHTSLCWKGDGDGVSDAELRTEVLKWLARIDQHPTQEAVVDHE